MESRSCAKNVLTRETFQGLLMTTASNEAVVISIRCLLTEQNFTFVLTRTFYSDPIESFFGWLRRSAGSNDRMDMRAAISDLEKISKTGITSAAKGSNVAHSSSCETLRLSANRRAGQDKANAFPKEAKAVLEADLTRTHYFLPTPELSAMFMVGGYFPRVVKEHANCSDCFLLVI
ncbi:hypothetical protein HPB47_027326 [Ixodes persulcatus]|uniref:Uncharacterized protein n=1 Tax=Ixodes persulcatus TaxID=34615 RepID=A0AC60PXW6_IXOPE|nr:hypothetical protein HPB47_027326 [Ixodes persulcatus]